MRNSQEELSLNPRPTFACFAVLCFWFPQSKALDVDSLYIVHVQCNRAPKQRRRTYRAHGRINRKYSLNPIPLSCAWATRPCRSSGGVTRYLARCVPLLRGAILRRQRTFIYFRLCGRRLVASPWLLVKPASRYERAYCRLPSQRHGGHHQPADEAKRFAFLIIEGGP